MADPFDVKAFMKDVRSYAERNKHRIVDIADLAVVPAGSIRMWFNDRPPTGITVQTVARLAVYADLDLNKYTRIK